MISRKSSKWIMVSRMRKKVRKKTRRVVNLRRKRAKKNRRMIVKVRVIRRS